MLNERFRKGKARGLPRAFPLLGGFFFGDHHGSSTSTDDGGNGDHCIVRHSLRYYRHLGPVNYKSKLPEP